jgi:hypothetical protein
MVAFWTASSINDAKLAFSSGDQPTSPMRCFKAVASDIDSARKFWIFAPIVTACADFSTDIFGTSAAD